MRPGTSWFLAYFPPVHQGDFSQKVLDRGLFTYDSRGCSLVPGDHCASLPERESTGQNAQVTTISMKNTVRANGLSFARASS